MLDPALVDRLEAAGEVETLAAMRASAGMQTEASRQHRHIQALAQGVTAPRRVGASRIRVLAVQAAFADLALAHDGSQVEALMDGLAACYRE